MLPNEGGGLVQRLAGLAKRADGPDVHHLGIVAVIDGGIARFEAQRVGVEDSR